jgi:WhiB family transcriptional regulator, redox-sensing transcriptional regulator
VNPGRADALLAGLRDLGVEPWRLDALCQEPEYRDLHEWFADRGESTEAAKAVCARCLVADECLAFALSTPETAVHGIWGGTSGRERRGLRKRAA